MAHSIAEIMLMMPNAFVVDDSRGLEAVVHFKFTGTEAGEWNAVIRDGKCEVARGIPRSRPTISLTADSEDFVRVATGELNGAEAFMDGRLKMSGDLLLAPKLVQLFRLP